MAVMTPPPPQSILNQGETFDDLPFVAENSTFCPAGTAWSKGIQSSVAHGAPLSRWITTLDPKHFLNP
jgi:hypothetical protein